MSDSGHSITAASWAPPQVYWYQSSPVSCLRYVVTFAGCIGHSWVGAAPALGRTFTQIASP
jgi:hypothetical protein